MSTRGKKLFLMDAAVFLTLFQQELVLKITDGFPPDARVEKAELGTRLTSLCPIPQPVLRLTVSSAEFEPVPDGKELPKGSINFRRFHEAKAMGERGH